MEGYRNQKRDNPRDSKHSNSLKEQETQESSSKRAKNENFEKLHSTRTELLHKHFGYTDENNPFGDEELTQPFIWGKNEKFKSPDNKKGPELSVNEVQSKVDELKELKQRRKHYELEKSKLIESRLTSDKKNDESYEEWEAKEMEFNLKQIVAKPLMRYKQGRPKLVDKLILTVDPDFTESFKEEFEINNLFKRQSSEDVKEAVEIINAYLQLEKLPESTEYLENLLVLAKEPAQSNFELTGVSQMVGEKIDQIMSSKSLSELEVFETQIKKKLELGVVDTNFWETALSRIPYFKACRYVSNVLRGSDRSDAPATASDSNDRKEWEDESSKTKVKSEGKKEMKDRRSDGKKKGSYEKFVQYTKLEEDEEIFDDLVDLRGEHGDLETPKYFNRVKRGYEWTKYNMAHYDPDHPPPKLVQGYRFNIFYPELKGKVPQWKLQKDGEKTETALIRFIGGAPYRDIAFRVVNKEWVTDPQKGFKNFFDNGVLHLYFDFKKIKYRR
ncbi:cactin [Theileria orientalis strain Shintoku]|uniref:Splicing factor Cactin n=1 Tax=Theileria orientalis strain Shintoku TaxID=869250 RepID=J4C8P3_THEOR|nr:cactin [Theileria orientalis strain Shintoku]PVC54360.1 cactin [Theileria orientalis]BAM41138.1 cactin [Theileria orientalis strain Shintoku]|eukprot:XP_009691439.1 cactin [Theileria orientalis strain Shintoku]